MQLCRLKYIAVSYKDLHNLTFRNRPEQQHRNLNTKDLFHKFTLLVITPILKKVWNFKIIKTTGHQNQNPTFIQNEINYF